MLNFFYTVDDRILYLGMLWGIVLWCAAPWVMPKKWRQLNLPLCLLAVCGILFMTVLCRTPSDRHIFQFFAGTHRVFCREMLLNVLLFFPLGLTLTTRIGLRSIAAALGLSLAVEAWQYVTGMGTAQGSDVLMNTLGCAIGAIPYAINRWIQKHTRG